MIRKTINNPKMAITSIADFCAEWRSGYFDRSDLVLEFQVCRWDFLDFMEIAKKHKWWQDSMMQLCNLPN